MELKNFEKTFDYIARYEEAGKVFDDFLTICLCCLSIDPRTGKSRYEDEYMDTIKKYDKRLVREYFPKLFAELILQMEKHFHDTEGNDLLGTFFERHISKGKNGQYFTPPTVTQFMAQIVGLQDDTRKRLNVLDPACGSGRMLLSGAQVSGKRHNYYGIDLSPACVKMTAINMFLNGLNGEVMCANALDPSDFRFSYEIKPYALLVRKIIDKDHSKLYHMNLNAFTRKEESPSSSANQGEKGQLTLF